MKNPRLNGILELLKTNKDLTVEEISKTMFVSPATVRRDLTALEKSGMIIKRYGKIIPVSYGGDLLPFELRLKNMDNAKSLIGKKAAELVGNSETVFIDSSSTCTYLAENLKDKKNITVITNSIGVVEILANGEITVYCLGGKFIPYTRTFVGSLTDSAFDMFQFDKCFFSVASLSYEGILSDGSERESALYRKLLSSDAEKILLCDSSKIGKKSLMAVGDVTMIDRIVTDSRIDENFKGLKDISEKLIIT